jgi:hypothetical protein
MGASASWVTGQILAFEAAPRKVVASVPDLNTAALAGRYGFMNAIAIRLGGPIEAGAEFAKPLAPAARLRENPRRSLAVVYFFVRSASGDARPDRDTLRLHMRRSALNG